MQFAMGLVLSCVEGVASVPCPCFRLGEDLDDNENNSQDQET